MKISDFIVAKNIFNPKVNYEYKPGGISLALAN